jgi:multiple sugar transport system substrate-binding protein
MILKVQKAISYQPNQKGGKIMKEKTQHQQDKNLKKGLTRRDFIKKTGKTGVAIAVGTGVGIFGGKPPAFAQKRTVHSLQWSHFIKEADVLNREMAKDFEKATGVKVTIETINANDLPARATAAVESGTGPDILQLQWNHPHLYEAGLENHNKLVADLMGDAVYSFLEGSARVKGVYRGVPRYGVGNANVYRVDIFDDLGIKPPDTWEDYLRIGKKLKDNGTPVGQTLGHTFGDAPTFVYPFLWAFDGMELDKNGKVAINSKETAAAVDFMKEFWEAACDPGGTAWDDTSNNRAFFAETIAATLNGASIYFVARRNPEKAPPGMADKLNHFLNPKGPAGRFHNILTFSDCITKYSKNKEAAQEWIRYVNDDKVLEKYLVETNGYCNGPVPKWEKLAMWKADPAITIYGDIGKYGRNFGYAGPFDRKASEVQAKYIMVDLFAKAVNCTMSFR